MRVVSAAARDQNLRRGAGEQVHRVMLGVPEPRVTEFVDVLCQVKRVGQRLRGR